MSEHKNAPEKHEIPSVNSREDVSLTQMLKASREQAQAQYAIGLMNDTQWEELECLLDARLADYRDGYGKIKDGLKTGREAAQDRAVLGLERLRKIRVFSQEVASVEDRIKTLNDLRKQSTGVIGGVGDALIQRVKDISGSEMETGKDMYERQFRQLQDQIRALRMNIRAEFGGQDIDSSEKASADALVARLDKASETELAEVSWWKAVFNSAGIDDIQGNIWSHENVAKKNARNIIGAAEGLYELASFPVEIVGKAIGIYLACWWSALSEGTWDSSVRRQAAADIWDIFSALTVENAKKALDLIPQAVEAFKNASPDEQAEGFGKFLIGFLVGAGIGAHLVNRAKYAKKLGNRVVRMAKYRGWAESVLLEAAGKVRQLAGAVAEPVGRLVSAAEMHLGDREKAVWKNMTRMEVDKLDISPRIVHEIESAAIVLKDIPDISPKELERALIRIIRDNPGKEIKLDDSLTTEAKQAVLALAAANNPLVGMVRITSWSDVVNITNGGIKKLNDTKGQKFVDSLMDKWRRILNDRSRAFALDREQAGTHGHARLVRSDYKNHTGAFTPGVSLEQILFAGAEFKQDFIQEVIRSARKDIEEIARQQGQTPEQVEAAILTHLDFGVGKSSVPDDAGNMDKLYALYEAEMNSRMGLKMDRIEAVLSNPGRIERYAHEALNQRAEILKNWEGKTFVFEGVEYPVVLRPFGTDKPVLHPQLLRQVRKEPEAIEPKVLAEEVWKYMSTLNNAFDFIVPSHNLEADFQKAHEFNVDFQNGIIKPEAILYTYKGTLSKEAFFELTEGKIGMRAMIDIKDMGLANFASFEKIAEKVASGNYTREDLLGAGKEVTEQFIAFVEAVRHKYPDVQISLGGDEVYLFFEGATENNAESILTSLHNNLGRVSLEGRIGHSFEPMNSREVFAQLDNAMNIHKKLEASIEKELSNNMPSEQHKTIIVHIDKQVPLETNFLSIVKWAQVQGIIKAMMQSVKEGKTFLHETLRLTEWVTADIGYAEGKFQLVFTP